MVCVVATGGAAIAHDGLCDTLVVTLRHAAHEERIASIAIIVGQERDALESNDSYGTPPRAAGPRAAGSPLTCVE